MKNALALALAARVQGAVQRGHRRALAALLAGATGIGFAPIFVRLSEVGPSATAFYRLLFALPFLWAWLLTTSGTARHSADRRDFALMVVAGLFFTGDLAVWHWSLRFTSVANSTLLTNFAPLLVTFGAWLLFKETISAKFIIGLALALAGAGLLVSESVRFSAEHTLGDALAGITALFYAGYLLTLKRLRERLPAVTIMAVSGVVSAIGLLLVALLSREQLWPSSGSGWLALVALALISHLGGQTLIAHAFGHLPASISSLNLLLQPVVAAGAAWLALGEGMSGVQAIGAAAVLAGIFAGSWFGRRKP